MPATTSLGDLFYSIRQPGKYRLGTVWVWLYCNNPKCGRAVPATLAQFVIRWGADASTDMVRRNARCAKCGHRGATIRLPSWGGASVGPAPFPVERMG